MDDEQRAQVEALADSMDWRGYDPEMGTAIRALLAAYDEAVARVAELEEIESGFGPLHA